jgi:hypothetical protein
MLEVTFLEQDPDRLKNGESILFDEKVQSRKGVRRFVISAGHHGQVSGAGHNPRKPRKAAKPWMPARHSIIVESSWGKAPRQQDAS